MNNAPDFVPYSLNMRLIFLLSVLLLIRLTKSQLNSNTDTEALIIDNRLQNSCEISENNFNRSCIYHKIVYLLQKLPYISTFPIFQVGPVQLIKLPGYASGVVSLSDEKRGFQSISSNIMSIFSKSVEYFTESYGIKIPLPPLTKNFPGVIIDENSSEISREIFEGRGKKKDKKFAMVFPLIATFKFILIKALLIPILMGIIAIKKMLVMAAMAVPTIIAMLRLCRWGPGLFPGAGPGGLTAAAATAPVLAPYVASDTIIGDFSNYAPLSQQTPIYSKQTDYGGKSYI